jgi:hypothetical protein
MVRPGDHRYLASDDVLQGVEELVDQSRSLGDLEEEEEEELDGQSRSLADAEVVEHRRLDLHLLDAALDAWSLGRQVKPCELAQPLEQQHDFEQLLERLRLRAQLLLA